MLKLRISPGILILSALVIYACSPKFTEDFYFRESEIQKLFSLSESMKDNRVIQLARVSEHIIIVNSVIVNTTKNSYGTAPGAGYPDAFEKSSSTKIFSDWDELISLVNEHNLPVKSKIEELFALMSDVGSTVYNYQTKLDAHVFQSGASLMRGYRGVLICDESSLQEATALGNYAYVNEIKEGAYYFEFR